MVNQEQNARNSIKQHSFEGNDYFTPQNSLLIGSISTLQSYEEGSRDIMKAQISDQHSRSTNIMDIERHTGTVLELKIMKKEDSDYCIIRNESETNDGWLIVDD